MSLHNEKDAISAMNAHASKFQPSNRVLEAAGAKGAAYPVPPLPPGTDELFEEEDDLAAPEQAPPLNSDARSVDGSVKSSTSRASRARRAKKKHQVVVNQDDLNHLMHTMGHENNTKTRSTGGSVDSTDPESRDKTEDTIVIETTAAKLREAEKMFATEVYNFNEFGDDLVANFRQWCLVLFLLHITQSLLMFVVAARNTHGWQWFTAYPEVDDEQLKPNPEESISFNVLWMIPFVCFLASMEHLCCLLLPETHTWYLERSQNPFRWTEYMFSASLMKVVIAQQVGMSDVHLLLIQFFLMFIVIQCGATHEAINAKARGEDRPQSWRCFFMAVPTFLLGWAILFTYFAHLVQAGGATKEVWVIMIGLFLSEAIFPVVFVMVWKKIGPFADFVFGEKIFLILGFVSKTLLCWLSITNVVAITPLTDG